MGVGLVMVVDPSNVSKVLEIQMPLLSAKFALMKVLF